MEIDLETQLYEDLEYLFEKWPMFDLSNSSIKRASSVLNRLFDYKLLVEVWVEHFGKQQIVIAAGYINVLRFKDINVNDEIGVSRCNPSNHVGAFSVVFGDLNKAPKFKIVNEENLPLKSYFLKPCLISGGRIYSREQIVRKIESTISNMVYDPETIGLTGLTDLEIFGTQVGNCPLPIKLILDFGFEMANSESIQKLYIHLAQTYAKFPPVLSILGSTIKSENEEESLISNFKEDFWKIYSDLKILLELSDQKDFEKHAPFVHDCLSSVLENVVGGNYKLSVLAILQLNKLVSDLSTVKSNDPIKFKKFRKRDLVHKTDAYYGFRFELYIWALLIEKKVAFVKSESPDFININGTVSIEATSCRIRSNKHSLDSFEKIKGTIDLKLKKGYLNVSSALFIDITNILHEDSKVNYTSNFHEDLKSKLQSHIIDQKVGSIILYSFFLVQYPLNYQALYIRIDNSSINDDLFLFLNEIYPKGDFRVMDVKIPHENV